MSLPKEILEQMLSGYLDDALSADERARFEQLAQSNAEIADELAQLRDLRDSLKAVARADSAFKLDDGFADRVVVAAVARARAEGLGDDHPLIRVAEQPSTTRAKTHSRGFSLRVAGALVALAASVAIAVIALRPDNRSPYGIAEVSPKTDGSGANDNPTQVPDVGIETPEAATTDRIAALQTGRPRAPADSTELPGAKESDVEGAKQPAPPLPSDIADASKLPSRSMKSGEPPAAAKVEVPKIESPAKGVGTIFVLHVKRSESGRQTNAVREAMKLASIDPASERKITDEIAGVAAAQPKDEQVSVLYLQASVKQIDQFYLRLMADQKGIESVGISIATGAPIMNVVDAVRPNPTLVRHTSMELTSDNGVVDWLSNQLGQLPFAPLSREYVSAMPSNGPDEASQVLVLIE